ncbi:ATP-dependent Clp protease ATP-binding subunit [bacterium]|nr:ATP-dependent Clp protease ATP-binding subunit [bacterium]
MALFLSMIGWSQLNTHTGERMSGDPKLSTVPGWDVKNHDGTDAALVVHQVIGLIRQVVPVEMSVAADGKSFRTVSRDLDQKRKGLCAVYGKTAEESVLRIQFELLKAPRSIRVSPENLFEHLSRFGDRVRLIPPAAPPDAGTASLCAELRVQASPMTPTRSAAFLAELKNLEAAALALQEDLPEEAADSDLLGRYRDVSDVLECILPAKESDSAFAPVLDVWCRQSVDFMNGSLCLAVAARHPVEGDYLLAQISRHLSAEGATMGRLVLPSVNGKMLVEAANKAPGTVVVHASCLNFGINPYEMANEVQTMLQQFSGTRRLVVFTGSYGQLQAVFHGGQGGINDPLLPVIRHAPDIPEDSLIRFAVDRAGQKAGGLPAHAKSALFERVRAALNEIPAPGRVRVLSVLAQRELNLAQKGCAGFPPPGAFVAAVHGLSETFSGLAHRPRAGRLDRVQERMNAVLTRAGLADTMKTEIVAQDDAIDRLVARLRMECLTRPSHQPIRYCAQGTPATGKSQSAVVLARELDVPYINIDAASIPDFYTASAQLLGSGRGIVGSFQSGRLEQAAKHHAGALVEVSDLDHAPPHVRSAIADIFLQILETGEGQSAAGNMFSCANLLFAFTINLPNGRDEGIRKRMGFQDEASDRDVRGSVLAEIKQLFSGAFLSRIGTPVLFRPLDGPALVLIVERAVRDAIRAAASRMQLRADEVRVAPSVGQCVIAGMENRFQSMGARALLEHARSLAAEAFMDFLSRKRDGSPSAWVVDVDPEKRLVIQTD